MLGALAFVAYRNLPLGSVSGAGTAWIGCTAGAACMINESLKAPLRHDL
jgi:hypothetical protein